MDWKLFLASCHNVYVKLTWDILAIVGAASLCLYDLGFIEIHLRGF